MYCRTGAVRVVVSDNLVPSRRREMNDFVAVHGSIANNIGLELDDFYTLTFNTTVVRANFLR